MTEFKVIETQEQLNAIIKARLDREKEKYADYDTLAEKIKKLETENSNLKQTISDKETSESTTVSKIAELEKDVTTWKQNTQPLADKEPNVETNGIDSAWRDVLKNLK